MTAIDSLPPKKNKKNKKKEQPHSSDHEKSLKKAHEKDIREIEGEHDTKTVRNTELCLLFPR